MLIRHTPRVRNPLSQSSFQKRVALAQSFPVEDDIPAPQDSEPLARPDRLVIQDARQVPRDKGFPNGGFVFYEDADPRAQHLAQNIAGSFADRVLHPHPSCHIGFLGGTQSFFQDTIHLMETVSLSIEKESEKSFGSEKAPRVSVYFGTHSLRTFLFAYFRSKSQNKQETSTGGLIDPRSRREEREPTEFALANEEAESTTQRRDRVCETTSSATPSSPQPATGSASHDSDQKEPSPQGVSVTLAGPLHLEFRRFKEDLSWPVFQEGLTQFLNLLQLTESEKKNLITKLRQFCDAMIKMRYPNPFSVPQTLPWEDLQRRFGTPLRKLWQHWILEEDAFQPWCPWKQSALGVDPKSLITHHWECLAWEQCSGVSLSRLQEALEDTFCALLKKLSTLSHTGQPGSSGQSPSEKATALQNRRYGLRSFVIHVTFNDGIAQSYPIHLAHTLIAPTKDTIALLRKVFERLPQKKMEIPSQKDPSFFVTLTHAIEISVEPRDVVVETEGSPDWDLFHGTKPKSLKEICFSLQLKSKHWLPERSFMTSNLDPENGTDSCKTSVEWRSDNFSPDSHQRPPKSAVFEAAQHWRPAGLLKTPQALDMKKFEEFTKNFQSHNNSYFEYAETFFNHDFHWLTPKDPQQPRLWVRSPAEDRALAESQRRYELVGFDL